eukprot:14234523-Ditylum_brightwellii.AAC.1
MSIPVCINHGEKKQNNVKQSSFIAGRKVNIRSHEDEGIKVKEESMIGIGKENVDPDIYLLIPLPMHP